MNMMHKIPKKILASPCPSRQYSAVAAAPDSGHGQPADMTTDPVVAKCGDGHFTDMQVALPRDTGVLTALCRPRARRCVRRHDGGADIIKSSSDYDDAHIVDEKSANVNNVNMMPKTPEMLNDNDYVKNNMDDKNNSYNVEEKSRDATSLPRRRHVAVTSLTRH